MKKLYRFKAYFGRMGTLAGLFVADDAEEVAPAIGRRAYFGEALGKHSEVEIDPLEPKHFEALTDDAAFIEKFEAFGCASGVNPLHYLRCEECGEGSDDCQCEAP